MDQFRYYLALVLLIILPPVFLFWIVIHLFVRFWRRLGPGWAYGIVCGFLTLGMAGLFRVRRALLAVEFGTSYFLLVLGVLIIGISAWLHWLLHRDLTLRIIIGLPELAPKKHPTQLITKGLYARIRHPRYVQVALALIGYALIGNYLALYVVAALWIPGIYAIVILEEKELRDRFGAAYEQYCQRVPRFIPKF